MGSVSIRLQYLPYIIRYVKELKEYVSSVTQLRNLISIMSETDRNFFQNRQKPRLSLADDDEVYTAGGCVSKKWQFSAAMTTEDYGIISLQSLSEAM